MAKLKIKLYIILAFSLKILFEQEKGPIVIRWITFTQYVLCVFLVASDI